MPRRAKPSPTRFPRAGPARPVPGNIKNEVVFEIKGCNDNHEKALKINHSNKWYMGLCSPISNRQPRRQPMREGSFSLSFVQILDGLNGRISCKYAKKLRAALFSSRASLISTVKKHRLQPACADHTRCFSLVLKKAPGDEFERSNDESVRPLCTILSAY